MVYVIYNALLRDSTSVLGMFAPLVLFLDADYVLKLHALSVIQQMVNLFPESVPLSSVITSVLQEQEYTLLVVLLFARPVQ